MRAPTLLLPLALGLLAAGCKDDTTRAADAAPPPTAGGEQGAGQTAGMRGAPFRAEVVAIETDGRTITLREVVTGPSGVKQLRAVRIASTAAGMAASLRPGDQVLITCEQDSGGMGASAGTGMGAGTAAAGSTSGLQACAAIVGLEPQAR